MRETLRKADRIKRRKDLRRAFRQGRCASDGLMRLRVQANSLGRSRMAVTVSARHGKAVRRNRIKRLCREAFRTCRGELPCGFDYVLWPEPAARLSVAAIRASLRKLAGRLTKGGAQ